MFFSQFTPEQRARRPLYPFLPPGLDADALDDMVNSGQLKGPFGIDMYLVSGSCIPETDAETNVCLPVPPQIARVARTHPDLYRTLVIWLYSSHHPVTFSIGVPRFEEDEDDVLDFDRPLNVDAVCTDETIMARIMESIEEQVQGFRRIQRKKPIAKYAWAADAPSLI